MVSFSCEACGDVLTKKKLDPHRNQCRGASYTCIDCMQYFPNPQAWKTHTSCISEAQKYQGHLYREKDSNKKSKTTYKPQSNGQDMNPRNAYVEDAPEADDMNTIAIVDVPPRAPTPPPLPSALPETVNVFDYLVTEDTPSGPKRLEASIDRPMLDQPPPPVNGEGYYMQHGFAYGNAPLQPTFERYDSWQDLSHTTQNSGFVTPGPRGERDGKRMGKSDKKRKRQQVDDLDLVSAKRPISRDSMIVDPPTGGHTRVLHSGLTGGLSKLITDHEFYSDRIDAGPTPISPLKRHRRASVDERKPRDRDERRKSSHNSQSTVSKATSSKTGRDSRKSRHDSSSSEDDRRNHHRSTARKAIEYPSQRPGSVQPTAKNQLVSYSSRADLFLSFINKGPDSERGCSINKALKRYHRERDVRGDARDEDDKELWKSLRLRRNEHGEVVLFVSDA